MAIDSESVRRFWDSRATKYKKLAFESVANLEEDPQNLEMKIREEQTKVFKYLPDISGLDILDLGAGVGQWAFRFAERNCNRVVAVEYSRDLVEIGCLEAQKRTVNNVHFVQSAAEEFVTDDVFDVVFISGLFVYLNDDQVTDLLQNLSDLCSPFGRVVLRDGTAVDDHYELDRVHSEHLDSTYSAIYRTREEYIEIFRGAGFRLLRNENMFAEGSPLNKYPETRLALYEFAPESD